MTQRISIMNKIIDKTFDEKYFLEKFSEKKRARNPRVSSENIIESSNQESEFTRIIKDIRLIGDVPETLEKVYGRLVARYELTGNKFRYEVEIDY